MLTAHPYLTLTSAARATVMWLTWPDPLKDVDDAGTIARLTGETRCFRRCGAPDGVRTLAAGLASNPADNVPLPAERSGKPRFLS